MATEKYKEQIHLDFIYWGTMIDYAQNVHTSLEKSLEKATALVGDLEGRVHIAGSSGEAIELDKKPFYHGNVTIEFEYSSEKPLPELVNGIILPKIMSDYVMPHLNRGKCAVLKNMYPNEYMITMAAQIVEQNATVLEALKRTNVPTEFAKSFLGARPVDLP